jgi:hypothetical protein
MFNPLHVWQAYAMYLHTVPKLLITFYSFPFLQISAWLREFFSWGVFIRIYDWRALSGPFEPGYS